MLAEDFKKVPWLHQIQVDSNKCPGTSLGMKGRQPLDSVIANLY